MTTQWRHIQLDRK